MKIKYSELKRKTKKELLELKEILKVHNMRLENHITSRRKNFNPIQVRRNIARINQRLKEIQN